MRGAPTRCFGSLASAVLVLVACEAAARDPVAGRPVRWTRPPNYSRCTDPADSLQPTDGLYAGSAWIWLDRRTVGWELHAGDVVGLTIDLGRSTSLDSVILHTAAFAPSGVFPPSLLCAIGDTLTRLVWAGALESPAPSAGEPPRRVRLAVPLREARGRFLLVAAMLRGDFLFIDEIETRAGKTGGATPTRRDLGPPGRAFGPADLAAVCSAERRVWALRAALAVPVGAEAQVVAQESGALAARAARWRGAMPSPLRARRVDPWRPVGPWSDLQAECTDTLRLWPGAWGAAAIDVASSDTSPRRVRIGIGPAAPGAPRATLRCVVPVESRDGRWAGDALPLAGDSLELGAGVVRQVWVDIDAAGAAPGRSGITIEIDAQRVEIPVRVYDARLPAPPIGALDWTYPEKFALTRVAPADAVRDNVAHGIDTWCLPSEAVPWPDPASIDARGRIVSAPAWSAHDAPVALHHGRDARRLGWYLHLEPELDDPSRGRFGPRYLSSAWKTAFTSWLDLWLAHLESLGLDRRRLYLQLFDETTAPCAARLYEFLHAARPDLRLALTVTRNASPDALRDLGRHLGLVILERETLARHAEWIRAARARGVLVWVYDVIEASKAADPTRDYRALAWEAWARGLDGCAFWAYGDTGEQSADAWDDFDGDRNDFAVVYGATGAPVPLRGESFVPSKRWQAFRIGMQETSLLEAAQGWHPGLRDSILAALGAPEFAPDACRAQLLAGLDLPRRPGRPD